MTPYKKGTTMLKKLLVLAAVLLLPLGATVAAAPRAEAAGKAIVVMKVCEHLGLTGRCEYVYKNSNGLNFYDLSNWVGDNGTSVLILEPGKTAITEYHENGLGFGWGTECGRQWAANAKWYIGDGCNDDFGAALLA